MNKTQVIEAAVAFANEQKRLVESGVVLNWRISKEVEEENVGAAFMQFLLDEFDREIDEELDEKERMVKFWEEVIEDLEDEEVTEDLWERFND